MANIFEERLAEAKQKRDMARLLRQQYDNQPSGQMVSGWYVPNTGNAVLGALANVIGGYQESEANKEAKGIERERSQALAQALGSAGIAPPQTLLQQAGTPEEKPGFLDRTVSFLRGEQAPVKPAQPYQVNVAQNVTPEQYEAAIMNLGSLSPESASMAATLYNARQSRELTKAEKEYQHAKDVREQDWRQKTYEETRADRLARESADRDLRATIAGNKQAPAPVQIMGPNGQPIYVRPEESYGHIPFTGLTLKQQQAEVDKENQNKQASLSAQQVLDQAEILNSHPGRLAATGASSWMSAIPGTDAKGFQSNLETFKSQTFVPMVSALKGMGALSDAEGKKLTQSVGALDPAMSEQEFQNSLKNTTKFLYSKAKAAGLNVAAPSFIFDEKNQNQQPSSQDGWSITPVDK